MLISAPDRQEGTGRCKKSHNKDLQNLSSLANITNITTVRRHGKLRIILKWILDICVFGLDYTGSG
jgi:hypothetical protein